eukprot:c29407_g1_i1 orf=131-1372(+)
MLRVCKTAAACRSRRRIHATRAAAEATTTTRSCIRLLSSYPYPSSPERAGAEEVDCREVGVFWDFENCSVPSSLDPFLVRPNIERALRTSGFLGPISFSGYGNIHQISRAHVLEALSETGVDLHHVPNGGTNASDRALLIDVMLWTMKHSAPANVLLISGDSDFSVLLHKLRMLSYNVLLAAPNNYGMATALVHAASRVWVWPDIATGEGLLGQVHISGTPLPRVKDDTSRNKDGKPNMDLREDMGRAPENVKDIYQDPPNDVFSRVSEATWVPSILVNRIINIIEGSPGISLGEISKELRAMSINPRAFGYPSFYQLLTSINKLEIRFSDGIGMKDRVRFHLASADVSHGVAAHDKQLDGCEKPESNASDKVCINGNDKGLAEKESSGQERSPASGALFSWGSHLLRLFKGR